MKTLIFSDTHLTPLFDQKKFDYLSSLIKKFDNIVINGDFYDGYLFSFEQFEKSKWGKLLSILKSKKTNYLFGNHDKGTWIRGKVDKYVISSDKVINLNCGKYKLHLEHGDLLNRAIGDKMPWAANKVTAWAVHLFRTFGVKIFGLNFYTKINPYHIVVHNDLYNTAKKFEGDEILVCGHSHTPFLDPKNHYANSGFIDAGWSSYLVLEDGEIKLVRERY